MESSSSTAELFLTPLLCTTNSLVFCGFGLFWLLGMIIAFGGIVFWIFMLIDLVKRDDKKFSVRDKDQKLIWILILVLTGWIGALVYYFVVYKKIGKSG